jgi:hypothetical protein
MAATAVAMAMCRPSRPGQTKDPGRVVQLPPPITTAAPPVEGGADAPGAAQAQLPPQIEFAADGTLIVASGSVIVARAEDGTLARQARSPGADVAVSAELPGVLLQQGNDDHANLVLLATPTLQKLYAGKGDTVSESPVAVALPNEVLLQGGGALLRLALPSDAAGVGHVALVASGTRINVTVAREGDAGMDFIGVLYDARTGARVGRGLPLRSSYDLPRAATALSSGYLVEGHRVARLGLDTGRELQHALVRCPADTEVGNPTPSPTGSLLLVTCGSDGVVLDGLTLAERRRIPDILPGCDNGPVLGGLVLPDGHTLLLSGCGGEARLDLARGRYSCADEAGLIGKPYNLFGDDPRWQAPPDRRNVPPCRQQDAGQADDTVQRSTFGSTGRYALIFGDRIAVQGPRGRIELEEGAGVPVMAPDERSFAYATGQRVVIRGLPDGAKSGEIAP